MIVAYNVFFLNTYLTNPTFIMRILSLYIGINNYPIPAHQLNGCVADMISFRNYIKGRAVQDGVGYQEKVLKDAEATRDGIIKGFDIFAQAQDGDICVLYYSGHGSRAPVPKNGEQPMFEEIDGKTESIVAYDSRIPGGRDIIDKELAYLIHRATEGKKVHFAAVFDCCHAGSNSRDPMPTRSRMAEPAFMPRNIDDVLGYKEGFFSLNTKGFFEPKPENPYIALAASRNNQTAKELTMPDGMTRGVFTYSLIDTLQKRGGKANYQELKEQIDLTIRNIVTDQNPVVEPTPNSGLEYVTFLGGALSGEKVIPKIAYHKEQNEWILNQGTINGLTLDAIIQLRNEEKMQVALSEIRSNEAVIDADYAINWDTADIMEADIIDLGTPKIQIAFAIGSDSAVQVLLQEMLTEKPSLFFEITDHLASAAYFIYTDAQTLSLVPYGSALPMFKGVRSQSGWHAEQVGTFIQYIETVLRHQALIALDNPRSTLNDSDIELEVYKIDATAFTPQSIASNISSNKQTWKQGQKGIKVQTEEPIIVDYYNDAVVPMFRLKLKNTVETPYFVGAVIAYGDYTLTNGAILNKVMRLEANNEVWLREGKYNQNTLILPFFKKKDSISYPRFYPDYLTEINITVKIIISTNEFSINQYEQDGLELAEKEILRSKGDAFSLDLFDKEPINDGNWMVKTVRFVIRRQPKVQALQNGVSASLAGLKIKINAQLHNASVQLTTAAQGTRDIGQSFPNLSDKGIEDFSLNQGLVNMPALNVLELNIQATDRDKITKEQPIVLELEQKLAKNEVVIPMGCIEGINEKGEKFSWYYPVGGTDKQGNIHITHLPDPYVAGARSLTGAIKVFFQKVVLQEKEIQTLRQVNTIVQDGDFATQYIANTTEELKQKVQSANNIVVFIHGIIGDTEVMVQTMKRINLEQHYDLALAFDYESLNTGIADTAKAFQTHLAEIGINAKTTQRVHIIAHSMGGLVSRYMLEKSINPPRISHLVQLGTPNNGSPWGDFQAMVQTFLPRLINIGGTAVGVPWYLTRAIAYGAGVVFDNINNTLEQMQPNSEFLQTLNDGTDPKVPLTIIAGNTSLLIQDKVFLQRIFSQYNLLNHTLFKQNNDIAVTVESIQEIKGGEKRVFPPKVVPAVACDHVSYFLNQSSLDLLKAEIDRIVTV